MAHVTEDQVARLESEIRRLEQKLREAHLTMRDEFAKAALPMVGDGDAYSIAHMAYEIADAMMESREVTFQ